MKKQAGMVSWMGKKFIDSSRKIKKHIAGPGPGIVSAAKKIYKGTKAAVKGTAKATYGATKYVAKGAVDKAKSAMGKIKDLKSKGELGKAVKETAVGTSVVGGAGYIAHNRLSKRASLNLRLSKIAELMEGNNA